MTMLPSYLVFRNELEYRKSSYSTKSRAVVPQRHVVSHTCVGWCEAKWAYKNDGFVEPSPSALE